MVRYLQQTTEGRSCSGFFKAKRRGSFFSAIAVAEILAKTQVGYSTFPQLPFRSN
jgi:hypothetical protein